MKKLQIILLSAALACGAFAQEKPIKDTASEEAAPALQAIISEKNDEKFPKEITDSLSPLMKKVKDMVWGDFLIDSVNENFLHANYGGNHIAIGENPRAILHIVILTPIPENTRKYGYYIANMLNTAVLAERADMDFKHFTFEQDDGGCVLVSIIKIRNSGGAHLESEIKARIETLKPHADKIVSRISLFNAGFDPMSDEPYEILNSLQNEKLPLKFLRIETQADALPLYCIKYESSPETGHIRFIELRNPTKTENINFDEIKKGIKENPENANFSEETKTFANIKFQTAHSESSKTPGHKTLESAYYAKCGGAEIYFEVSTPFPRTPEAQKIIDEMIEKRTADKMPTLPEQEDAAENKDPENAPEPQAQNPQAQAHAQGEKAPQAPKVSE